MARPECRSCEEVDGFTWVDVCINSVSGGRIEGNLSPSLEPHNSRFSKRGYTSFVTMLINKIAQLRKKCNQTGHIDTHGSQ